MLSDRTSYIINLLLHLVEHSGTDFTTSKQLADATRIPDPYLRKIIAQLAALGYLETKKGPRGGVHLGRAPGEVALTELLDDAGTLNHVPDRDPCCRTRGSWRCFQADLIRRVKTELLDGMTLASLFQRLNEDRSMLPSSENLGESNRRDD